MRRWPLTLWRSITGELWKLLLLVTPCLVLTIALGATVPPLSSGLLSLPEALKFVALALPAMAVYALPFAGGFASTLVYHRMGTDNEALAAYAGGVSHRSLLAPALFTSLVMCAALAVLNELIVPRALHEMSRMVQADLPKLLTQAVQRGRAVEPRGSDLMLSAESARRIEPEPGSGVLDIVVLGKFTAVRLDERGNPAWETTAQRATLWLVPAAGELAIGAAAPKNQPVARERLRTRAIVRLENSIGSQAGRGQGGYRDAVDLAFEVRDVFWDKASFMSLSDLWSTRDRPEAFNWVDLRRRELAYQLAAKSEVETFRQALQRTGSVQFKNSDGRPVTIRAAGLTPEPTGDTYRLTPSARGVIEVEIARQAGGGATASADAGRESRLLITAPSARLSTDLGSDSYNRRLYFRVELEKARTRESGSGEDTAGAERATLAVAGLSGGGTMLEENLSKGSVDLLERSRTSRHAAELQFPINDLAWHVAQLGRDIMAKANERLALAATSVLMVLTGAVTSLKLSRRLPLTVYLWTFVPAVLCLVTISGGHQLTTQKGEPGLALMWLGVAVMAVYTGAMYRTLSRH